jgi:hypothetical protein
MPEEHDERAGYGARDDFDELDDFDDDEFDNDDEPDDFDDDDDDDGPGRHWPAPGFPPGPPGDPPGGWAGARRYIAGGWGGGAAGRGRLLALTAVVAAAFGFGVVVVALHEGAGPASAGAAPGSGASPGTGASGAGNGTQPAPRGGGPQSLPPGAMERLEIGGQVMAVSATSITLNGGGQAITAAVTQSTTVTGKVTTIRGVKVGDFVSATLSGTNGKLTADSIQDPASLPAAPRQ